MADRKDELPPKGRIRVSLGISIGDTVPLWGRKSYKVRPHRWFYGWANRPCCCTFGGIGFKAGFVFVRLQFGRKPA